MTCKDCIHYDVCLLGACVEGVTGTCLNYKDKSRIVELPCKVGDTLYYPWAYDGTSGIAMLEVASFGVYWGNEWLAFIEDPESDMPMPNCFSEEDFGKTVFLTREEAKEALRKAAQK